jgi:hypothetical protein
LFLFLFIRTLEIAFIGLEKLIMEMKGMAK